MNLVLRPVDPGAGDLEAFFLHQNDAEAAAFVAEHNVASIRVLEKNGFVLAETQPEPQPDDVEECLYLLR